MIFIHIERKLNEYKHHLGGVGLRAMKMRMGDLRILLWLTRAT